MATKYAEGLLAILYRKIDSEGHVLGGPFYYIENGMGPKFKWLGKLFAFFGAAAAAQSKEPVRQGLVSMTGTFIDTIIICTMTGLSIIITGSWNIGLEGVAVTNNAFREGLPFHPEVSSLLLMLQWKHSRPEGSSDLKLLECLPSVPKS